MLKEIEEGVIARLQARIAGPNNISIDEAHSEFALKFPSTEVICGGGHFERVSQKYKLVTSVFVIVTFAHLQNAKERRHATYPILLAITVCLMLQKLGLAITPLIPKRLDNITEKQEAEDGKIVFQLEFETSFIIDEVSDEEVGDLLSIGLMHYLQPDHPTTGDTPDAVDIVTLREP